MTLEEMVNSASFFAERLGISEIEFIATAQNIALVEGDIEMVVELEDLKRTFIPNFDTQVLAILEVANMIGMCPLEMLTGVQETSASEENEMLLEVVTMIKCKILEDGFFAE